MFDYMKRLLIATMMVIFITILFFGAKGMQAVAATSNEDQEDWLWPVEGTISDTFASRNGSHYGIDISAPQGTPVLAANSGTVSKSYYSSSYGHVIFITHNNGMDTVYAHLHKRLATEGTKVARGEQIGEVGSTGRSTGNHLHFEVHNGSWNINKTFAIDPLQVLGNQENLPEKKYVKQQDDDALPVARDSVTNEKTQDDIETITIEQGDTLWAFSQQYNVTVSELMEWNDLHSSLILTGEQLVIYQSDFM